MIIAASVTFALFFGLLCHYIARKKGRSRPTWLVLGALFGPFALIAILLMGELPKTHAVPQTRP